jgi:hypothetical protein
MAHDDEFVNSADEVVGRQAERAAEASGRRPWVKPAVHLFSLQKTLAGSGPFSDGGGHSQVTPT